MSLVHRVPVGQLCRDVVVMLVISTLTKWKPEDLEFKVILGLIASSKPAWTIGDSVLRQKLINKTKIAMF